MNTLNSHKIWDCPPARVKSISRAVAHSSLPHYQPIVSLVAQLGAHWLWGGMRLHEFSRRLLSEPRSGSPLLMARSQLESSSPVTQGTPSRTGCGGWPSTSG